MTFKVMATAGAMVLALTAGAQAQTKAPAQGSVIGCPKAGTVVDRTEGDVTMTTTYRGSDPSDPAICLSTTNGKEQRILYGVYLLTDQTGRFDGRSKLDQLFSGKAKEVSFTSTLPTVSQNISIYFDKWTRLDPQSMVIAGRTVNALVFQRTISGQSGNAFSARFTYFYDPVTAVWVKRNETVWRGDPEPMAATKITLP
jgi:hypothetical protein